MRIYLAGPCKSRPNNNQEAFEEAEQKLRELGHTVVGLEFGPPGTVGHLPRSMDAMNNCDALCLLPGWETSQGTLIEKQTAQDKGLEVFELYELLESE